MAQDGCERVGYRADDPLALRSLVEAKPAMHAGDHEVEPGQHICRSDGDRVRGFSRRGNDYTDRVPLIAEALAKLRLKSATIDGEGVVCRPDGVSDFDRLRCNSEV
jgi:hypothetical protein